MQSQLIQHPGIQSLVSEVRAALPTKEAAHQINRRPQTLRRWACLGDGPIKPVRINGRLAWKVSDLRTLLEVAV